VHKNRINDRNDTLKAESHSDRSERGVMDSVTCKGMPKSLINRGNIAIKAVFRQ